MDEFLESLLLSSSTWPEMSSDQVPGIANPILVENDFGSGGSSSSELSAFGFAADSFVGSHSPLPSPLGHLTVDNFFCNGEGVDGKEGLLGKRPHPELEEMVARETLLLDHQDDMQGNILLQSRIEGTQSPQQNFRIENSGQPFGGHSAVSQDQSGGARPRTRARRGQATDPHSIAERHRRERISERMKSLQLLVPNSNKTDKASMLDEIIDYVQFLQLQVKVLSISRLGGSGAVSPLNVDVPHERAGGLVSTCLGQAGGSLPLSQEALAFEQEFARLMESNMTTAMQYLQNKGLCLLPIALASAISSSSGKPLLPTMPGKIVDNSDRQKADMQSMVSPLSGSSTDMVLGAVLSGTDASIKKSPNNKDSRQEATEDKLNVVEPLRYFDVANVGSQREELLRRGQ